LKALSGKELVNLLQKRGWVLKHVRGSHHVLVKEGYEGTISVPVHGNHPLKRGMLVAILKEAGIKPEEL